MKAIINNVVEVAVRRMVSAWKPGQPRQDFESNATTWGQLKRELGSKGFSLNDVRVSEGNTQIDLVNDDAILPTNINKRGIVTNDLVIIMTPQTKIKSGMIDTKTASYKELKAEIKEVCNDDSTKVEAKKLFGNYTQLSTDNMRTLLAKWYSKNGSKASAPIKVKETPKKEAPVSKPVEKTKEVSSKSSDKFKSVQEKLENKDYTHVAPSFNKESYNEGLSYILFGITQLQNEVYDQQDHNLPSDNELEQMAKRMK